MCQTITKCNARSRVDKTQPMKGKKIDNEEEVRKRNICYY